VIDLPNWFDPAKDAVLTPKSLRGLVHPLRSRLIAAIGLRPALLRMGAAMLITTLAPFVFPAWRTMNRAPLADPVPAGVAD
jgi:hypothetical protein